MRIIAVILMVLALVIGIVPQFTNCHAAGSMNTSATTMTTVAGAAAAPVAKPTIPRCFYSARSEIGVAVSLFAVGAFMFFSRRKESWRALSTLGIIQGLFAILLPAVLIGVCTKSTMECRTTMMPTLYAAGGVVIALSLAGLIWNEMKSEK